MIETGSASGIACVFDMDGVLLDSEPLHHRAVNQLLADEGCGILSFEDYVPYMGTTDEYTWRDLISRYRLAKPFEYFRGRYDEIILEHYRSSSVLSPGAANLLENLRSERVSLAVASSSRSLWVSTCLNALGIRGYFDVVVSGDMVQHSKPDPEIFLLAAEQLSMPPDRCYAIEDSPKGVAAAVAAGMFTVAVSTPYIHSADTDAAQLQVASLQELDTAKLRSSYEHSLVK